MNSVQERPCHWGVVIYDREGDILFSDWFECEKDAEDYGAFWQDDPRYGSHEVEYQEPLEAPESRSQRTYQTR